MCWICSTCLNPDHAHTPECVTVPATVGHLCSRCAERVRESLDWTVECYFRLDADPLAAMGSRGKGSEPALPGGKDRLDYLLKVPAIIAEWVRWWMEDYNLQPPDVPGIASNYRWVRSVLERYAFRHEAIEEFATEMRDLAREGRRLAGLTDPGRGVPCPGQECERYIRIDINRPDDLIYCKGCRSEWTGARILLMALASADPDTLLDAEAIHHLLGVPPRTLRRWASEGRVRRDRGLYVLVDVQKVRVG